jgi:hypothetical protein
LGTTVACNSRSGGIDRRLTAPSNRIELHYGRSKPRWRSFRRRVVLQNPSLRIDHHHHRPLSLAITAHPRLPPPLGSLHLDKFIYEHNSGGFQQPAAQRHISIGDTITVKGRTIKVHFIHVTEYLPKAGALNLFAA